MRPIAVCLSVALAIFSLAEAEASVIRVDAGKGETIQAAADKAAPGDVVLVAPGVYYESVIIRNFGLPGRPVVFRSEVPGKAVVTCARKDVREGKVKWRLDDAETGLYSIPYEGTDYPARLLYGRTDLYPYASLEGLKTFTLKKAMSKSVSVDVHGPRHGYFWSKDEQRLYVRLHASGKYGNPDPNAHVMCAGPEPDGVSYGCFTPTAESKSCFRVLCGAEDYRAAPNGWPAYVEIEGFRIETPSLAGVYTEASDVTVRNCRFLGCRLGVSGDGRFDRVGYYRRCANRVRVTGCGYTQYPTYEDGIELVEAATNRSEKLFWHRKHANEGLPGKRFIYESGIIGWAALDWEVDHCKMVSCFEGISAKGATMSEGLRVHDNVFERMLDNAIEFEDSAQNVSFCNNIVRDVFSPVSWQPLRGRPLPGPCYVYGNTFYNTPEFCRVFNFRKPGVFKIMGPEFGKIVWPGVTIFNNTIYWARGWPIFGGAATGHHPDRISFCYNVVAADHCFTTAMLEPETCPAFTIRGNVVGAVDERVFASARMAGDGGLALEDASKLGLKDPEHGDFSLKPNSPARGRGGPVEGVDFSFKHAGAWQ